MAHRISAPALHAAVTLKKSYCFEVLPTDRLPSGHLQGLTAQERCLAILIDYATNVFELCLLRPELRYWQDRLFAGTATASQIGAFCKKVLHAYELIPQHSLSSTKITTLFETPPQFGGRPTVFPLSKASLEAARFLFYYYEVRPRKGRAEGDRDRIMVAKLVEASLELVKVMEGHQRVKTAWDKLKAGQLDVDGVKQCFRELGVALEYLPNYKDREEEVKIL